MMGWLADAFRLVGGFLFWNCRKSLYRLAPRRFACPCQCPSDSGRAHDTRCEACLAWHRPSRFRWICPALVLHPEGHRCALPAAQVRPYWGRALLFYGLAGLLLWTGGTGLAWTVLRSRSLPVSYLSVAWPPHWPRITTARAALFRDQGFTALRRGQLREASLNLNLAWSLDRTQLDTALALARLSALTNPGASDEIFQLLLRRESGLPSHLAPEWLGLLLARGDFVTIRDLARSRLVASGPDATADAAPWMHALIVATRKLQDTATLDALLTTTAGATWRPLIEAERLLRQRRTADLLPRLTRAWQPAQSYFPYYQVHSLLLLRRPTEALDVLAIYDSLVPDRDKFTTWLATWALLGQSNRLQNAIVETLEAQPSAATLVALSNHLIRYPNANLTPRIWAKLSTTPLRTDEESIQAYASFFCACALSRDGPTLAAVKAELHRRVGARFIALDLAENFFLKRSSSISYNNFLPLLPLPLNSLYALQESVLN